jgi:orotidine-5'-phosphate decarboxylase
MVAAAKAVAPANTKVVAVTVLTSLDGDDLAESGIAGSPADQVSRLTRLAQAAGVDGIVCSGAEVAPAKRNWPGGFFVVPGVRPAGADVADQKRVVTPAQALADGADVLVIGRPITSAADPVQAIRDIAATLNEEARIKA